MRRLLLRLLAAAPTAADHISDAELLRRFAASNDAAAFELILRRHADAVWAAVFHILKNETDAEDAFQASFLALIRKAKRIRATCVGGWLHRVAVHAALKLRERTARVASIEPTQLDAIPALSTEQPDAELVAVVHEELAQLSERERLPLILCELEGMSHADAAKALGWRVGTVSGRLSRARAKLRERLARRGLTPAGALLPALVAPPQLIPNVLSLTAGAASPAVISLTEGVLAMNTATTWKWVAVGVMIAGTLGVGGVFAYGLGEGSPAPPTAETAPQPRPPGAPAPEPVKPMPQPAKDKPADENWLLESNYKGQISSFPSAFPDLKVPEAPKDADRKQREELFNKTCPRMLGKTEITIEATDDPLRKLLKARLHAGVRYNCRVWEKVRIGTYTTDEFGLWMECLNDMRSIAIELWSGQPKELVPWLEEMVVHAKEFERFIKIRVEVGSDPPQRYDGVIRLRLAMEAALWKAKKGA